jgi:hypothetical protein
MTEDRIKKLLDLIDIETEDYLPYFQTLKKLNSIIERLTGVNLDYIKRGYKMKLDLPEIKAVAPLLRELKYIRAEIETRQSRSSNSKSDN